MHAPRRLRQLASLAVATTALLVAPAAASADWSSPFDVSGGGEDIFGTELAVGPDGVGHAAWDDYHNATARNTIQYASFSADGTAQPQVTVSAPPLNAAAPAVAAGPGYALVGYMDPNNGQVYVVHIPDGGSPSAPMTAEGSNVYSSPRVAVDSEGTGTIVWRDGQAIEYRRISQDGTLASAQVVTSASDDVSPPAIAVDGNGNTIIAWAQKTSGGVLTLHYARIDKDGNASVPVSAATLPGTYDYVFDAPRVAVNDAGAIAITAAPETEVGPFDRFPHAAYVVVPAGQTTGTAHLLDGPDSESVGFPAVALYPDGRALIVAINHDDGASDSDLWMVRVSAAGVPSAPVEIADPGSFYRQPAVNVDAHSRGTITWVDGDVQDVQSARVSSMGVLGPAEQISGVEASIIDMDTASDPDGNITALWFANGGLARAARFAAPPMPAGEIPAAAETTRSAAITKLRLSKRVLSRAKSRRTGLRADFSLSDRADVKFELVRVYGRTSASRCRPVGGSTRGKRARCEVVAVVHSKTLKSVAAGDHRFVISAKVSRKALRPGAYKLVATVGGVKVVRKFVVRW